MIKLSLITKSLKFLLKIIIF